MLNRKRKPIAELVLDFCSFSAKTGATRIFHQRLFGVRGCYKLLANGLTQLLKFFNPRFAVGIAFPSQVKINRGVFVFDFCG